VVRGLAIFQEWFKDFENHYVLIGGTVLRQRREGLYRLALLT